MMHTAAVPVRWQLTHTSDIYVHAFLLCIASWVFSNGLHGGLVFDDHLAIERNMDTFSDKTSFSSIFFNDFWGKALDRVESNNSYRPFTILTFRLQYWLMGNRHSPTFLHAFNYVLAFLNVCGVFYLTRLYVYMLVPAEVLAAEGEKGSSFRAVLGSPLHTVPLVSALLFLVHPVHVDAVTSIVGRSELLYCFFGLVGFFYVHRYLNQVDEASATAYPVRHIVTRTSSPKAKLAKAVTPVSPKRRSLHERRFKALLDTHYIVLSFGALAISIFCKDSAITFTALYSIHACVMYLCDRCQQGRMQLVIGVAALELISYVFFRRGFIGHVDLQTSPLLRQTENPQYFVPKGWFHWLSIRWVIQVKNIELLFFPLSLCCEYSFDCIPHLYSLRDARVPYFVAVSGAALLALLRCGYSAFVRRSRAAAVGLLAFLWIAVPYAPVSHLFISVGTFIAERCLYVPSIGAVLIIILAVAAPALRSGSVSRYLYMLLLLCAGWGIFSHLRNEDWLSDERLFRAAIQVCPKSGKPYSQLAALLTARANQVTPEVVRLARKAIALDPGLKACYFYLAIHAHDVEHNPKKAYEYLRLCVRDPFASDNCRLTFIETRKNLYPHMTESERLIDNAALSPSGSQSASMLRQAGLLGLQQEHAPCAAVELFGQALDMWEKVELYWVADPLSYHPESEFYCNTLYWYAHASLECEQHALEETASLDSEANAGEGEAAEDSGRARGRKTLTPPEAAAEVLAIARRYQLCETDWDDVQRDFQKYRSTLSPRMTEFLTIGVEVAKMMAHYLNYSAVGTPERVEAALRLLELDVRMYCHIATLLKESELTKMIKLHSPGTLYGVEKGFPQFKRVRLAELRNLTWELKMSAILNASQSATLQSILGRASCSADLSFLAP